MKRIISQLFIALVTFTVGNDIYRISNHELLQLWVRQDNINVFYSDQEHPKFSVYRSLSGNLFLTLTEPHPATGLELTWHYLIRPKEATAEIGFQGELVDWRGKYAVATVHNFNDKYVFSGTDDSPEHRLFVCREANCPKVTIGNNFIELPSVYYKDTGAMIRVSW